MDDIVEENEERTASPGTENPKIPQIPSHSSMARFDDDRPNSGDLSENDRQALRVGSGNQSRPNTTGRMPSKLSRPMMSRSSFVPSNGDFSSDSDEESGSFLITEVKHDDGDDLWRAVNDTKKKYTRIKSPMCYPYEEDDGYWDTDLEIEDERTDHDVTGRTQYASACQRLGTVPVSYFSRHITDADLTMRYHGLGPLGAKAIAKVLRSNFTMEKLNLSGNWMEGEGGMYMARMLVENDNITHLDLSDNKLGTVGAYHLSKMLLVNISLKSLVVSANDFNDESAACFAEALEQNKSLKELYLARNRFDEEGGGVIGPAIGANDVLDHIDLSWNMIRRKGAIAVAKGLKENVRLKSCNLSWNGLGPLGGAAIADAITTNESLQELDISGNRLDFESACLIGKALRKNEELKILRIGNNPIMTTGSVAIATAIKDSDICSLTTLDLQDIPVEFEFLKLVDAIKKKRPSFEVIHGPVLRSGNTNSDIGKPAIDPILNKDPLLILREHIVVNDTRIFDILKKYDTQETLSVSPDQFAAALEELGVPISNEQLVDVTKRLDKNSDGKICYGDMMKQFDQSIQTDNNVHQGAALDGGSPPGTNLKLTQRNT